MVLFETTSTTGEAISNILQDIMLRLELSVTNLRGQRYDGASNMARDRKGVQARLLAVQPKALYVHCSAHGLNVSVRY